MFNLSNFAGFAIFGAILAGWNQIKGFLYKIISLFIRTDEVEEETLGRLAFKEIISNGKIIRWGNIKWRIGFYYFIKKFNISTYTYFRGDTSIILLYRNKIPIILAKSKYGFKVTYLLGTFKLRGHLDSAFIKLVEQRRSSNEYNEKNRHYITYCSGQDTNMFGGDKDRGGTVTGHAPASGEHTQQNADPFGFDWLEEKADLLLIDYKDISDHKESRVRPSYYWSPEAIRLYNEIKYWSENASWFVDRNISHRRGAVLSGPPGGGKSKMVLECAQKLGIPVTSMNISNMSSNEFKDYYTTTGESKMIIMIEDIDAIFDGRNNILAKDNRVKSLLSFDTLINTIGGIKENNGIFLIITSNHIEKLDPALLRPGRCDVHIEIGYLDITGREVIANNILRGYPDAIKEVVEKYTEVTVAAFENYCIEKALEIFYSKKALDDNDPIQQNKTL